MPIIQGATAPQFTLPGVTFFGLAAPSRGSRENAVWRLVMTPGTPALPHRLTREEIFVATAGSAIATVSGERHALAAGDSVVVPAGVEFSLHNPGEIPFEAVVVLPVGGQAMVGDEAPFTPPWAA
jgi:mannose-6-phosphate isomerase-like protein (cupin superfamily)